MYDELSQMMGLNLRSNNFNEKKDIVMALAVTCLLRHNVFLNKPSLFSYSP
jgi:hypothetical protein